MWANPNYSIKGKQEGEHLMIKNKREWPKWMELPIEFWLDKEVLEFVRERA